MVLYITIFAKLLLQYPGNPISLKVFLKPAVYNETRNVIYKSKIQTRTWCTCTFSSVYGVYRQLLSSSYGV